MSEMDKLEYSRVWGHFPDARNTMIQIGNNKFAEHGSMERLIEEKLEAAERIFKLLSAKCSNHVLEIGSGLGIHTAFFAERASRVYTVDVSDGFSEYFNRFCGNRQNVTRIVSRFFPMLSGIKDATLDCAFATAVFCHLHVYDIALYFEELKAKLRPGAVFYINFQNSDNFELTDVFTRYLENYRSGGRFVPIQPAQMQFHSRNFFRAIGMKHDLLVAYEKTVGSYTEMLFQRRV
jgi:cyclopropane fatty-acyl-phospholipid synthase-like methyltransferase